MAFWPADPEVTILGSWWIFRLNVKQWEHANKRSFDSPRRAAMFFCIASALPATSTPSKPAACLACSRQRNSSVSRTNGSVCRWSQVKAWSTQATQTRRKTMENENLCIWYHLHQSVPPFFSCLLMFTTGQHWADFMSHTLMVCLCWHKPTLLEAQDCKVLQKWTDALTAFGCWRSSWLLDCAKSRSNTPTQSHWAKICQSRISSALSVPCRPLQLDTTGNFSDVTVSLSLAESKSQAESV